MRIEERILKDFELLGYKRNEDNPDGLIWLDKETRNYILRIEINKFMFSYCKFEVSKKSWLEYPIVVKMSEHKLLHELFELWGWL